MKFEQEPVSLEEKLSAKKKTIEEKISSDLRLKISKKQEQKDSLRMELENLKKKYEEGSTVVNELQEQSTELQGVYNQYEGVLKEEGIDSKSQMIQNPEYSEDDKVVKFKETGKKLRDVVGSIKESKNSLKNQVSDLDFRGVERGNESPRDISYKKIEEKITELDRQTEELEAQTPERITREKNIVECIKAMKEQYIPFAFNRSSLKMQDFSSCTLYENGQGYIQSLIERFGEEEFKEALMRSLSTEIDKSVEMNKKDFVTNHAHYGFDFDIYKEKILKAMETKIDQQLTQREIQKFKEEHPTIETIREEVREIESAKNFYADRELEKIQERKSGSSYEKWSQSKINIEIKVGKDKKNEVSINYEYDPSVETADSLILKKSLEEKRSQFEKLRKERQNKLDNPPMIFGKQKHLDMIKVLNDQIKKIEAEIKRDEENYTRLKQNQENKSKENIWELSQLINLSNGFGKHFDSFTYKHTTVGVFLDLAEKYWQEAKDRVLDPEKTSLLEEFKTLVNKEETFERVFKGTVEY